MLVPDTAEVKMFLTGTAGNQLEGAEAEVTWYVRDTVAGWPVAQLDLLRDYARTWWDAGKNAGLAGKTLLTGDWKASKFTAHDLSTDPGAESTVLTSIQGLGGGQPLPSGVCILIQYVCSGGGFPKRGRTFFPAREDADLDGDTFDAAYQAAVLQCFEDFDADLNDPLAGGSVNWAQVRVSRSSGTAVPPQPKKVAVPRAVAVTNTIAARSVRPVYASQRDRRIGE